MEMIWNVSRSLNPLTKVSLDHPLCLAHGAGRLFGLDAESSDSLSRRLTGTRREAERFFLAIDA